MADLTSANSGYQSGAIDSATTLVNSVSPTDAQHVNGPASACVQIETILGIGTTLKGSVADLATRLGISINADGTLKPATTSFAGGVELATQAEVNAMTSTTTVLTPNVNTLISTAVTNTTSGTSADSPTFPAGVRRIVGKLSGVSSNGTSDYVIQIGDSGGIETSGYLGTVVALAAGPSISIGTPTTYFGLGNSVAAAGVYDGLFILELADAATNKWSYASQLGATSTGATHMLATGTKSLSAELTTVRLTTAGGVNTFDAGSIVWSYER